jgi:hypothetical protein
MLARLASSVSKLLKKKAPSRAPDRGVPEFLAALTETRAKRAELERLEKEIIASTRAKLREQQEALEQLKRKVRDHGIDAEGDRSGPSGAAEDTVVRGSQAALGTNGAP